MFNCDQETDNIKSSLLVASRDMQDYDVLILKLGNTMQMRVGEGLENKLITTAETRDHTVVNHTKMSMNCIEI